LEAVFILLEFPSPSRRIFIGSHSLPPSLVRRIGPSAVVGRVDEVALYGVRLGTALGLAGISTRTGVDYSRQPPSFDGGPQEDLDDIEATVERLDGHGIAVADSIHP
jgi:hypothetical protein